MCKQKNNLQFRQLFKSSKKARNETLSTSISQSAAPGIPPLHCKTNTAQAPSQLVATCTESLPKRTFSFLTGLLKFQPFQHSKDKKYIP